jgi:hypothetical protein
MAGKRLVKTAGHVIEWGPNSVTNSQVPYNDNPFNTYFLDEWLAKQSGTCYHVQVGKSSLLLLCEIS